jgi:hypothetical protein
MGNRGMPDMDGVKRWLSEPPFMPGSIITLLVQHAGRFGFRQDRHRMKL